MYQRQLSYLDEKSEVGKIANVNTKYIKNS